MGGILGGGSSINFMMYTRAQGIDFDSWGTEGWAAKDMLPLCNKLETYHPTGSDIDQSKHGHDGPIHISDGGYRGQSENQFMETVKGMGYKSITDLQDLEANGAFSVKSRDLSEISSLTPLEMASIRLTRRKAPRCCTPIHPPSSSRWQTP